MAKLMNLLGSLGRADREILAALDTLDKRHSPVRMEIENSSIRFDTRLSLKATTVVVAKPLNLRDGLRKGGIVRFTVPETEGRALRMEVLTPHFNLTNGNPVFLCKLPTSFAQANQRAGVRFNTARFSNVSLMLNGHSGRFRVVDLSNGGCKIYITNKEDKKRFTLGKSLGPARIELGDRGELELDQLVPRNFHGQSIGCQFEVSEGHSRSYLVHLLDSLERSDLKRYRT